MKHKYHSFIFIIFFLALISSVQNASAYTLNSHEEIRVGNSGLFLLNFSFGHGNHTVQIPALASHSVSENNLKTIEYTITDRDGNIAKGESRGIVLSSALLQKNGMYSTEKGQKAQYVLAVLFTPASTTRTSYTLSVTHLPFMFDNTRELKLNPSELQYYESGALGF